MALHLWNIEWLDANSQRRYPLTMDASGVDESGDFTLPNDFLLELQLPIAASLAVEPGRFFLYQLGAYATGYALTVGYQPTDGDPVVVATALVPRQSHVANTVYALGGVGDFADSLGKVTIGDLHQINQQAAGQYTFSLENGRLEPDAIRPMLRGVTGIRVVNGGQVSDLLQGVIELAAGANVQLLPIENAGDEAQIQISAIDGEGTIEECVCTGEPSAATPIRRINGIAPTDDGDLLLVGDDCLDIQGIANGLKLSNTCAKPCCGCPELERITEDLQRLDQQAATVRDFSSRLQVAVDTMNQVVLAARPGSSGCS